MIHRMGRALIASLLTPVLGCAWLPERSGTPVITKKELKVAEYEVGAEMMAELVEVRSRILDIEYALTTRVAANCGELARPRAGVLLSKHESFEDARLRRVASQTLEVGDALTIVHLVPGTPLERAGLKRGDQIVSVDDIMLKSAEDLIDLSHGNSENRPVHIGFRRGDELREVVVQLAPACPVYFALASTAMAVPWQEGELVVAIPFGLVTFAESEDELAVAAAHQLAHVMYDGEGIDERELESRADHMGILFAHAAGFDVSVAPRYWERVALEYPWLISGRSSGSRRDRNRVNRLTEFDRYPHGGIAERMEGIRAAVEAARGQNASKTGPGN